MVESSKRKSEMLLGTKLGLKSKLIEPIGSSILFCPQI